MKAGETLSSIARRHGVSTKALTQHNGIKNPNSLRIGQTLVIPGKAGSNKKSQSGSRSSSSSVAAGGSGSHTIRKGETLSKVARIHGVSVANLLKWNGISDPSKLRIGQQIRLSAGGGSAVASQPSSRSKAAPQAIASTGSATRTHTLKRGETLSAVSRRHGVSISRLVELNGIADPTRLAVGQKLILAPASVAPASGSIKQENVAQSQVKPEPLPRPPSTPVEAYKSLVSGRPSHSFGQHTVRPGDTLHSISKENNISVEALRAANGLGESNFIRDNQLLKIPSAQWVSTHVAALPEPPRQKEAATAYEAPARTEVKPLFEIPPVPDPEPRAATKPPRQKSNFFGFAPTPAATGSSEFLDYTVGPSVTAAPGGSDQLARAEDIKSIADSFSTTVEEIRRLNRLEPGEELQIGRKIIVPADGLFGHTTH